MRSQSMQGRSAPICNKSADMDVVLGKQIYRKR